MLLKKKRDLKKTDFRNAHTFVRGLLQVQ